MVHMNYVVHNHIMVAYAILTFARQGIINNVAKHSGTTNSYKAGDVDQLPLGSTCTMYNAFGAFW